MSYCSKVESQKILFLFIIPVTKLIESFIR